MSAEEWRAESAARRLAAKAESAARRLAGKAEKAFEVDDDFIKELREMS
jgi:hypothetical protein